MAKTKREYILIIFFVSCICLAVSIVSVATNNWVQSDAHYFKPEGKGTANYGLFIGKWKVDIKGTGSIKDIAISCVINENICGWSFEDNSDKQNEEITNIFKGKYCRTNTTTQQVQVEQVGEQKCDLTFINAGLWICTVFCAFYSLFSSLVCAALALLNFFTNPTKDLLSIQGIFIFNILSIVGYVFTLIFWGSIFASSITYNIAISDTLLGKFKSNGLATLGYSYWILMIPMFLHVLNIGLIYYRKYLIDKEPHAPKIDVDPSKDGISFLY